MLPRYTANLAQHMGSLRRERCVTVGAPAAHGIGFSEKRMKTQKRPLSDQSWSLPDLTGVDLQQLRARDHCRSMALAAVISAATQQILDCAQFRTKAWEEMFKQ